MRVKRVLKWVAVGAAVVALLLGGVYAWASYRAGALRGRTVEAHTVSFPVPWPAAEGQDRAAAERAAIARGEHLVASRYACTECHGADLGGGVMVDDPALGKLLGPNLTPGKGSVTLDYTPADWDRAVRHGIGKGGRPLLMPAQDFRAMSDQELSDLVAYIRSRPPVDREVGPSTLGPIGTMLVATGKMPFSCDQMQDHHGKHAATPPDGRDPVALGRHLAQVCTGCHRPGLEGGPVIGGDPSWPPASNLTPHADGLAGWSRADFVRAMREGRRRDGTSVREPMLAVTRVAARMSGAELDALWAYLASVAPMPTGR